MTLARHGIALVTVLLFGIVAFVPAGAQGDDGGAATYILITADENALPAGLAQQVVARGGSITDALPEIGVAIATYTDADFAADA